MNKERTTHKVKINKNPRWIKAQFSGQYNGIMYKFMYREYVNKETESVARAFDFNWPGRIPENKDLAEEGIKALFNQSNLTYKVLNNDDDQIMEEKEIDILNELIDKSIEEIDETLQERQ